MLIIIHAFYRSCTIPKQDNISSLNCEEKARVVLFFFLMAMKTGWDLFALEIDELSSRYVPTRFSICGNYGL